MSGYVLRFCPHCGFKLASVTKFCMECGGRLPDAVNQDGQEPHQQPVINHQVLIQEQLLHTLQQNQQQGQQENHQKKQNQHIYQGQQENHQKQYDNMHQNRVGERQSCHGQSDKSGRKTIVFKPCVEPNEKAFTYLMPNDWISEGGVFRPNPLAFGAGIAQAVQEPFLDMTIMKDRTKSVCIHYIPSNRFYDLRDSFFPPGSNCNGMPVWPAMRAEEFLHGMIIPQFHQNARNFQVIDKRVPQALIRKWQGLTAGNAMYMQYNYDGMILTVTYEEGGVKFKEKINTATIYYGMMGTSMWENKETKFLRAPADEFDTWEPIFEMIECSMKINPYWLAMSNRGVMDRTNRALEHQRYIQQVDREIVENRQRTNAEINKELYLFISGQEEYVNPYTGKPETDTSEWQYRWCNENGYILYTDDHFYDPNTDRELNWENSDRVM